MKKNILFVVDEQMYGGVSTVLTTILKKLDYSKFNIDVLILHNRGNALNADEITGKVNFIYGTDFFEAIDFNISDVIKSKNVSLIYHKMQIVWDLKTGRIKKHIDRERKKILKKNYDIEIAFKDGFSVLFTAFGDSDKKISWLHTSYDICDCTKKYRGLFVEAYKNIDNIVAITEDVAKTFNKIYCLDEKTQIIENLIDTEDIIKKSTLEEIKFAQDKINFICVGRIAYPKGYPRLFNQLVKLKKDGFLNNVVIHMVGDGDEKLVLEKIVEENNLKDNIDFLGFKKNPYPYIAASDMLISPSFFEGLGLVLIEANILKVPCFATRFANIEKTLYNGQNGMIVENSDEGIYNGLKQLLSKNKEIINMYKENLKNFEYTKNKDILKKIERLLEEY